MLSELPAPPCSSELVLFLGHLAAAGKESGTCGTKGSALRLCAFALGRPGKQTWECASKKLKLMRVNSTAWELEFPFLWGIPWFCNGLLFPAGSKPASVGISYETKLKKEEQIL